MNSLKSNFSTTAIILFARSEKMESSLKLIAPSAKQNLLLWKKMNDRVLKTIQKTNLPYFIYSETNQVGKTFGEKITYCIKEVFAKGFENVIVVGNDCIALKAKHLSNTEKNLQTNSCVLGADYNGGVYLIGITKLGFNDKDFESIPWQTKNVFSDLQSLYQKQAVVYLPILDDCNSTSDFKKILHQLPYYSSLKKILLSFLFVPKHQNKIEINSIVSQYYAASFNKGSPFQ